MIIVRDFRGAVFSLTLALSLAQTPGTVIRVMLFGKIAPGDYVLQVIVTDKLAKETYRVATQSMDFEIQPVPPLQY
ncbi:MAG: hypothetical protein NTW28_01080 [Candidatus Solibacter sp.]|nr:hypothetical protein [Candidatus Solibacter sp.]